MSAPRCSEPLTAPLVPGTNIPAPRPVWPLTFIPAWPRAIMHEGAGSPMNAEQIMWWVEDATDAAKEDGDAGGGVRKIWLVAEFHGDELLIPLTPVEAKTLIDAYMNIVGQAHIVVAEKLAGKNPDDFMYREPPPQEPPARCEKHNQVIEGGSCMLCVVESRVGAEGDEAACETGGPEAGMMAAAASAEVSEATPYDATAFLKRLGYDPAAPAPEGEAKPEPPAETQP